MEKPEEIKQTAAKPNDLIGDLSGKTNHIVSLIGEQFKDTNTFDGVITGIFNDLEDWQSLIDYSECEEGILWIKYSICIYFKIDFVNEKYEVFKKDYDETTDNITDGHWMFVRLMRLNSLRIIMLVFYRELSQKKLISLLRKTCLRHQYVKPKQK